MNNPIYNLKTCLLAILVVSFLILVDPVFASDINRANIVRLTNLSRNRTGLSLLSEDSSLDLAAQKKADDMLSNNYFQHFSPTGTTPWDFILSSNYNYSIAAENLAMDFATSEGVNRAWLNSPTHARNLLNRNFTDVGVAVVEGNLEGHDTTLVVQLFGNKQGNVLGIFDLPIIKTVNRLLGLEIK